MQKQQDQGSAAGGMSGGLAAGRQQSDSEQGRADKGKDGGKPADEKQTGKEKQQNCRRCPGLTRPAFPARWSFIWRF